MPASAGAGAIQGMPDLDRLIHEPARFRIMARLCGVEGAGLPFLMRQTEMTKGDLSSQMRKLEDAGCIAVVKDFVGRKPHTMLRLTKNCRAAFREYDRSLKRVFEELPGWVPNATGPPMTVDSRTVIYVRKDWR